MMFIQMIDRTSDRKIERKLFVGDNSVSLRRIWTKLEGNSSYKSPGASYTAQGAQKQPEILKHQLCSFYFFLKKIESFGPGHRSPDLWSRFWGRNST